MESKWLKSSIGIRQYVRIRHAMMLKFVHELILRHFVPDEMRTPNRRFRQGHYHKNARQSDILRKGGCIFKKLL
jgi:hypothetical protein